MTKRLLFVVNSPEFFLSHRLPVALAAKDSGYEVHVATAPGLAVERIRQFGLEHHAVRLSRCGKNPFRELASLWALWRLMRHLRPSLVHTVTIKPVLYGGLAARLAGVPAMVAAVSGLGSVFGSGDRKAGLVRRLVQTLYRSALGHSNSAVIFQNPDDKNTLLQIGAVRQGQARLVRGSGVDPGEYPFLPEPEGTPVVTMAARLLIDKGVREFVQAARLLLQRGVKAEFRLIGDPDPGNPATVTHAELEEWRAEGLVRLLGFCRDIAERYAQSHVICLPSFYGEGLPKSLVEAAACGRAVVTTDMPGCRDAIEPGKSGLLIPAKDADSLADAIAYLIDHPAERRAMGAAGRALAKREFAIEKIVEQHLAIYRELEGADA
ncbi:glycosyltransferase family 4 protein [Guyparkeria hydrothermalis]|uniref:glycosyltransferase family 4 protein n=1 Tax=Guyparkeria hydrothermalis TaxID=923 RepID=UPI00201FD954|nr:glycosyltransferase family 4 protein [Guyparkeria hydrothermalis]